MKNQIDLNITDGYNQYLFYSWEFGSLGDPDTGGGPDPETSDDIVLHNEVMSASYKSQ